MTSQSTPPLRPPTSRNCIATNTGSPSPPNRNLLSSSHPQRPHLRLRLLPPPHSQHHHLTHLSSHPNPLQRPPPRLPPHHHRPRRSRQHLCLCRFRRRHQSLAPQPRNRPVVALLDTCHTRQQEGKGRCLGRCAECGRGIPSGYDERRTDSRVGCLGEGKDTNIRNGGECRWWWWTRQCRDGQLCDGGGFE